MRALLDGRFHVSCEDVRDVAVPVLRHRIVLNMEGEAGGMKPESLVAEIIAKSEAEASAPA